MHGPALLHEPGFKAPPGQALEERRNGSFSGAGPLRPEACTRGEGRRRRRVPSGTRAIISLTAPSPSSHSTALSPPPNCHITRRFPSRRPIRRTAARRTATGGGDVGDRDLDIGRNLLRSPHRHLVFARDLELVLGRKNGDPRRGTVQKRRAANVGHFQPDVGPDQFLRIVFKPTFNRLRIPHDFVRWFGEIPSNIIVTTNTGCYWRMTTVREGDDAYIDQGWAAFAVAHQLQIGQFLVFKKVSTFQYNVVIFDYTCTEVMTMCRYHGDATRQFPELTMAGFADALRPDKFTGVHFKRWQVKATLWLTHLKVFEVSDGLPEGTISDQDQNKFKENNTLFVGCVLSILVDRLCDVYMHITDGKELWDALNAKFGATDAGSELYIMESFHDIRMVNNRSVVEQAHEIQCIAKELELLKCALPDKFVAGCIIAKLPPSWRNFATTLKHKRQEISVENLIASLDVEEKARAKDNTEKGEGQSSANMVQKKPYSKNKGNNKPSFNKPMKTTTFKKKKMINKADLSCFTCGEAGHFSKDCPERADRKKKGRQVNTVTASNADGYGNLFTVARDSSVLMGNGSHASVRGVGTVDLKFTSGKIVQLRNMQHVPTMNKNLVSGSLLCRDGFKNVTEKDDNEAPKRSKRRRIEKSFGDDFIVYLVDDTPTSIAEAYASPDADDWKEAVHNEMDSILSNGTWELSERPHGCKPVGCKWVFKKKLRPDGTIEKYKARLVAKGYTQREGEDYFDTYSPVARLTTIRVLLSMAASYGLIVHQMDVKTAFLNGELEEEIYMDQPDGFVVKGEERKVCKLLKSLYGLKQAPKQWHEKFDRTLTAEGFVVNEADKCVYYRHGGGEGVILCLYVDDIPIFGTNMKVIHEVKSFLSKSFDMKDLGEADVILNIKLIKNESGITLTQSHYVEKILSRFGYIDSKPSSTPYDPSVTLRKNRRIAIDQLRYSQIVGSLMYLASATRPDISFVVSKLSRFMSNPGTDHWHALDRVMRYLCGTMSYGIHYSGHPAVLEGYSDSNWISDVADLYATSGMVA
ncbi:hypothetical protein QYE76_036129 [Lolium multiflorum]|uniref:Uncharacterized protein n=1 Tax=Lolium multiflorum TaxID=4521 RepID=A0AAD8VP40_LOLMU|nr:hypothetical protein QYE76_036129 [Lolium multiflorum]